MRLLEVNWLRFFAISSIFIWHCVICPTSWWNLLEPSLYTKIVCIVGNIVMPEANMPLFTCLSGYLFAFLFYTKKKGYTSFKDLLLNKGKRLFIPFLVLGSIATLVVPSRPFVEGMIWGDGSSLWFCAMLFWCTLLRYLVLSASNKLGGVQYVVALLSLSLIFYYKTNYALPHILFNIPVGVFCFIRAVYFYTFFVLGEILYKCRDKIICDSKKWILVSSTMFTVLFTLVYIIKNPYTEHLQGVIAIPYCVLLVAIFVSLTSHNILKNRNWLNQFCLYSFGVYVFHEPIAWNCYHNEFLLGIFRQYPLLYSLTFTIIVFGICYVLTHYCLKTKIGKFLLS